MMTRNRGMASVTGEVHDLNVFEFQAAATREAVRVATRDGLQSPWLVEVLVYNDAGPPSYLATICDGVLVKWEQRNVEEPILRAGEPLCLGPEEMSLHIGFSHDELEQGLESGEFLVLCEEEYPELGRWKIAAYMDPENVLLIEWRDPNRDGQWVWVKTSNIRAEWIHRLARLLEVGDVGLN